ncbi:MAG: hypothetical protein EOO04_32190, partial [Chitinophagaceae bacterium]
MFDSWYSNLLNRYYLMALIMSLMALTAITIIFAKRKSTSASKFRNTILFYLFTVVIQSVAVIYVTSLQLNTVVEDIDIVSGHIFGMVEFCCFSLILIRILSGSLVRKIAKNGLLIYIFGTIGFWFFGDGIIKNPNGLAFLVTVYL